MTSQSTLARGITRAALAVLCVIGIGRGNAFASVWQQVPAAPQSSSQEQAALLPPEQLDSLVAPVALYPDPLLAQVLAASTYPLDIMQLQQWLAKNPTLKGQALANAVQQQPWDPSVQAMAVLPDVVKRLADNIQWTTELGNAFVAQQSGVMDAVQRMRQRAETNGGLQSTPQQTVETQVVENKSVIVIEPSNPETIYVPSYNPAFVYGPAVYPYPSIYYPPVGYYAAGRALSFGLGVATGAFWGHGGGWGWNTGWGHNDITLNRNNNFIRHSNYYRGGNINTWQHNNVRRSANLSGYRAGAVGTAGINRANGYRGTTGINRANGYRGTTGMTHGYRGGASQYRGGTINRGNYSGSRNFNSVNRGNYSGSRNFNSVNRGSYSGSRNFSAGSHSFSGGRSFSGGGRSFSGGHRGGGGGFRGGGGGRRGGGGGRRR